MKNIWKIVGWDIALGISLMLILTSCTKENKKEVKINQRENTQPQVELQIEKPIYIQLCGAVLNPGIYSCKEGDYLFMIIEKAGGLLDAACFESVNQAQMVVDGQLIMVYTKEEYSLMKTANNKTNNEGSNVTTKVNINIADAVKLMSLPGIGEAKAAQIIEYRENKGVFTKIEDIMNIGGIKERLFETIKDAICVD